MTEPVGGGDFDNTAKASEFGLYATHKPAETGQKADNRENSSQYAPPFVKLNDLKTFGYTPRQENNSPTSEIGVNWNECYASKNYHDHNSTIYPEPPNEFLKKGAEVKELFAELQNDPEKYLQEFNTLFGTKFTLKQLKKAMRFGVTAALDGIQTISWFEKGVKDANPLAEMFNKSKHNPGMLCLGLLLVYIALKGAGGSKNDKYTDQWLFLLNIVEAVNVYYGNTRYGLWNANEITNPANPEKADWARTYPIINIEF